MTTPNGMLHIFHGNVGSAYPAHYAEDLDVTRIRTKAGWWTCPYHYCSEQVARGKMHPVWKMEFHFFGWEDKEDMMLFERERPHSLTELIQRLVPVNIPKHFIRPPSESATPTRGQ